MQWRKSRLPLIETHGHRRLYTLLIRVKGFYGINIIKIIIIIIMTLCESIINCQHPKTTLPNTRVCRFARTAAAFFVDTFSPFFRGYNMFLVFSRSIDRAVDNILSKNNVWLNSLGCSTYNMTLFTVRLVRIRTMMFSFLFY